MCRTIILLVLTFFCLSVLGATYTLEDNFSGSTFFNNFQFYTGADPTNGYVYYASQSEANAWGYVYLQNGVVHIRSDNTTVSTGSGRGSVRISSTKSYNVGSLFLFDVAHMPFGCGTWPAIWMFGPNWPNSGEIDVIEGVNKANYNSMTLHTSAGCTISAGSETGTQVSTDCNTADNGNQGCSVQDLRTSSYGSQYNINGGGVHAALWTTSGIQIWFFPRSSIPSDITSGNPNPSGWGNPAANFPFGSSCASSHFVNQNIILDNTFCGDWAGGVFNSMGCTGTCTDYVQNNPSAFSEAYWMINSFKVYSVTSSSASSSSSSSSSSASSSGYSTTGCGSGLLYCPGNQQCYSTSNYVCSSTTPYLCPVGAPHFCNGGCASTSC